RCLRAPGRIVKEGGSTLHFLTAPLIRNGAKKKDHTLRKVWSSTAHKSWLNLFGHRYGFRQSEVRLRVGRQDLGDRRLGRQLRRCLHRGSLDLHFLVAVHACTGRDEVTDDDVLLESEQLVPGAADGSVGQNTRRLLEARRRNERLSGQARLRDAKEQRFRNRRCLFLLLGPVVRIPETLLIDVLALEELGVA